MDAVIDVGSNTIRMLLGDYRHGNVPAAKYYREITRLAGDFSDEIGLSEAAMGRSLIALKSYKRIISKFDIDQVRVVGTAALRRANNRQFFIDQVYAETGFIIEVIDGTQESSLTTKGALSVVDPMPEAVIVLDIGGGSTELISIIDGEIRFQESYPLGVVRLCEEYSSEAERQQHITTTFKPFLESLQSSGLAATEYQLIGTAGTITTLAAIHLRLQKYDATKINNHKLSVRWLSELQVRLKFMSIAERDDLIGMEPGRGDLILPGLEMLLYLLNQLQLTTVKVSDSGLLEGVMINLTDS